MRKVSATTRGNKAEREAERDRQRKAFQEAYDREHPGPARMRRLVNERIAEPERSRLIALAGAATEFVWARSVFAWVGFDQAGRTWRIGIDYGVSSTTAVTRAPACLAALGLTGNATEPDVRAAFRRLVKTAHPDQGGTSEAFVALQKNYQAALALVRRSK